MLFGRKVQFFEHSDQVGDGFRLHFMHHLAAVKFDGRFADAEFERDLFVQPAGDDQFQHFAFAKRHGVLVRKVANGENRIIGVAAKALEDSGAGCKLA